MITGVSAAALGRETGYFHAMARMTKDEIEAFFRRLSKANPNPTTELAYTNVYTLLVAVVMSAQATDVGVNKATAQSPPPAPEGLAAPPCASASRTM